MLRIEIEVKPHNDYLIYIIKHLKLDHSLFVANLNSINNSQEVNAEQTQIYCINSNEQTEDITYYFIYTHELLSEEKKLEVLRTYIINRDTVELNANKAQPIASTNTASSDYTEFNYDEINPDLSFSPLPVFKNALYELLEIEEKEETEEPKHSPRERSSSYHALFSTQPKPNNQSESETNEQDPLIPKDQSVAEPSNQNRVAPKYCCACTLT